jgi:hypothetical protein
MIQLPGAASSNAPQTQNRKRLLAEITSEQMELCSREYRRHLAVCEVYGAEATDFVIFAAEWLEVRAKAEKTLGVKYQTKTAGRATMTRCTTARKATNETAVSQAQD